MKAIFTLIAALLLSACGNLAYYVQLAQGQYQLLSAREPIADILKDDTRDAALRKNLAQVLDARKFAVESLGLPDNKSYTLYAALDRPYVVWNVFAAPELSLAPVQHCFLIVGCLAYRGYFSLAGAQTGAAQLKALGDEVYVGGVPAYSTLGWFDDPVISSMMHGSVEVLIATVFHELTHQKLYIKNDTAFDESLASFVEAEALDQYLSVRGGDSSPYHRYRERQRQFIELAMSARAQLSTIYGSKLDDEAKRQAKRNAFDQLRGNYRALRDGPWQGYDGYDQWFADDLNNAKLLPFGLYDQWVPAFAALYVQKNRSWPAFFDAAKQIGDLAAPERESRLRALMVGS